MRTTDPHLGTHDVEWQVNVDKGATSKELLRLLEKLTKLLVDSGEEFRDGAIRQIWDQMALLRHFMSRLPNVYGSDGLLQELCRLSWLDNDFDRFCDEEVNKTIGEIVCISRMAINIDDTSAA